MQSEPFTDLTTVLALLCAMAGVVVFVSPLTARVNVSFTIPLALDFWMAAGLLRLSGVSSWKAIATTAVIIIIRKVTSVGVKRTLFFNAGREPAPNDQL